MQNYQKYHIFSAVHAGQLKKNEDRFNIEISIDRILNCKKRAFYQGRIKNKTLFYNFILCMLFKIVRLLT